MENLFRTLIMQDPDIKELIFDLEELNNAEIVGFGLILPPALKKSVQQLRDEVYNHKKEKRDRLKALIAERLPGLILSASSDSRFSSITSK